MSDTILNIRDLQVQFKTDSEPVKAVDGISFALQRGKTLAIVGESGSGKSVTSLAIMRLVPSPGEIVQGEIRFQPTAEPQAVNLHQIPLAQMSEYRGGKIAMIFQEPMSSLNPVFTCGFQLVEAIRLHQEISDSEARRKAIALLQEVKLIPTDEELQTQIGTEKKLPAEAPIVNVEMNERKQAYLKRYPHEFSGGQLQRVMIAMAISSNPDILIADEPTTALDVTVQATILDLLRELRDRRGMSILFITHDLGVVAELADEVVVMYQGKIVESGTVQQIFNEPIHAYTRGLLACRPQPDQQLRFLPTVADYLNCTNAKEGDASTFEPEEISDLETIGRLETLQGNPPILRVENLRVLYPVRGVFGGTKRYVTAVNGVSFDLFQGETLGLVGESGCGKTTLGRTLVRLQETSGGKMTFENQNITHLTGKALRRVRQDMQIIFQDPYSSLNPRMTVGAAIMEPMKIFGDSAVLAQGNDQAKHRKQSVIRDRAAYLLERVGLTADDMKKYPHAFSGGQRQRVCIARSLALNPKFIVCDESVSALDVSVQAQVLNLLKELQKEFNLTYIFISHDLGVVKFMSDRIMVMNKQGEIEEIGPANEIYNHPQQKYTQELIAAIPKGFPAA
jgi:peptide/nickel transport system ATP-binding protein